MLTCPRELLHGSCWFSIALCTLAILQCRAVLGGGAAAALLAAVAVPRVAVAKSFEEAQAECVLGMLVSILYTYTQFNSFRVESDIAGCIGAQYGCTVLPGCMQEGGSPQEAA